MHECWRKFHFLHSLIQYLFRATRSYLKLPTSILSQLQLIDAISNTQDVQSYSPEYNIMTLKYPAMKMDDVLDLYSLPANLKEVKCKIIGRKFLFLHSLNRETFKFKFEAVTLRGKNATSTRIIDETTLRIYSPMKPETSSRIPSMVTTFDSHGKDKNIKNFIHTMCYYTPTTSYIR